MMVTTHVLVGALFGTAVALGTPVSTEFGAVVGMVGGFVPDLDKALVSRRTFHYPVLSFVVGAVGAGLLWPVWAVGAVGAGIFFFAVGLHSVTEVLGRGGGLQNDVSERTVYNHVTGEWIEATYLIPEGSGREVLLNALLVVPILASTEPWLGAVAASVFGLSVVYALLKRRINDRIPGQYQTMTDYVRTLLGRPGPEWQERD